MRVLFTYAVSPECWDRFNNAGKYRAASGRYDHLVVSESPVAGVIHAPATQGEFCLSAYRNAALQYADSNGYDYLVIGDADSIFIESTFLPPATGFAPTLICHLQPYENPHDLRQAKAFIVASWWILARSMFHLRWCEEFTGYGWQDNDFVTNVAAPAGFEYSNISLLAYHMFHPITVDPTEFGRNHALFERRKTQHHG
jgi:hypothetical protein